MELQKAKNIISRFPASYEQSYISKPGEYLQGKQLYSESYVNGIRLSELVELHRDGYLDIKFEAKLLKNGMEITHAASFDRICYIRADNDMEEPPDCEVQLHIRRTEHGDWLLSPAEPLTDDRARELLAELPLRFDDEFKKIGGQAGDYEMMVSRLDGHRYNAGTCEADELRNRLYGYGDEIIVDEDGETYQLLNYCGFKIFPMPYGEWMELYRCGFIEIGEVASLDFIPTGKPMKYDEGVNLIIADKCILEGRSIYEACFWYADEGAYQKAMNAIHHDTIHATPEECYAEFSKLKMFRITKAGADYLNPQQENTPENPPVEPVQTPMMESPAIPPTPAVATGTPASESGGKKKRKPRTTIDATKIAEVCEAAIRFPTMTNKELAERCGVSAAILSRNKTLKEALERARTGGVVDRRIVRETLDI